MIRSGLITAALCAISCTTIIETKALTRPSYTSHWGVLTSINLYRCAPDIIRSQSEIERYIRNVFSYLGLRRYSIPQCLYNQAGFGYTSGYTAIQQANGHSDVAVRVDEQSNTVYIDFFSCATYDSYDLARQAQEFFMAYDMAYETIER